MTVQKAIRYLQGRQDPHLGAWYGRWGVNYIYGTSAALVGLLAVGEDVGRPYIQKALGWLKSVQQPDGGYGETTASYQDKSLAGQGVVTPTQTAWALLALISAHEGHGSEAQKAAQYLVSHFDKNDAWTDPSVVGTGHRRAVYVEYPSYSKAFTLDALAKFLKDRDTPSYEPRRFRK